LTSLADRRTRGDLIQWFKIETGRNIVELIRPNMSSNVDTLGTNGPASCVIARRRSSIRSVKELVKQCSMREKFFTNRVVDPWNGLGNDIVASSSVNCFKKQYDRFKLNKALQ